MKKSEAKIKDKTTGLSSPFDTTSHKTEWTCAAKITEWINRIVEDNHLGLGKAEVETKTKQSGKCPDIILFETPTSERVLCVMETKQPYYDVFNEEELKIPARDKAVKRKAPYFATCNFRQLIWYNTERVIRQEPEEYQIHSKYTLSDIWDLDKIEEIRFKNPIINGLAQFLKDLVEVYTHKRPEPLLPVDELLIFRLHEKVNRLARYYRTIIEDNAHKDPNFSKELQRWFIEQEWQFTWSDSDYAKVARQTAYLLVNKILFYYLLKAKRPYLSSIVIPDDLIRGGQLQKQLQSYFEYVLEKIDYETIYSADFIDQTAFPDNKEVVEEIRDLIKALKSYDFRELEYEIIGNIFQRLIPIEEQHSLGQYFTSVDVVDLILRFSMKHETEKVLDPSCGAGTFLVRAYTQKRLLNKKLNHEEILDSLWGVDIAKFPAHLATINLAIQDLSVDKNYPNIAQGDFFDLLVTTEGFELPEKWRKMRQKTVDSEEREITYPRWFDCVVGNPPYTRQEEIQEITREEGYKENLIEKSLYDINENKLANISKRAGIYAYFFVHGMKFLRDGGRFGFIVSNSWLDVDYGKGLQELFLMNYKITAIIESKIERWFELADINTCIVILEKCKSKKERDKNFARFVYLKKPLRYFIPPLQKRWEEQVKRKNAIEDLIHTILAHNNFYENEDLRIFPKKQRELWNEGYDADSKRYVGAKWGKYIRAPEIFFKILEKGKGRLVPLKEVAEVRRGYIPWPYEVFRLTKEDISKLGVKEDYFSETISSPTECSKIVIDTKTTLPYYLLIVDALFSEIIDKNLKAYLKKMSNKVERAEKLPENWYILEKRKPFPIIYPRTPYNRHIVFLNKKRISVVDHIEIAPKDDAKVVVSVFNSTMYILFREIFGRTGLGGGTLKNEVIDLKVLPFLTLKSYEKCKTRIGELLDRLNHRKIESVEAELGANSPHEVFLDKVKPDRRELDKIIMGEILGLTDEEQLEVYRAVIDLVRSRIDRAKSVNTRRKTNEGLDIDKLIEIVKEKLGENTLGKFYRAKILSQEELILKTLPHPTGKVKTENGLFGWRVKAGRAYIDCKNEVEAKYLKIFWDAGMEEIKIPENEKYLETILPDLEKLKSDIDTIINEYLKSIYNPKLRDRILHKLQQEIVKE
ncbi:N-6 DNA methylase [candidate division WOR-3 bacterium]|nr:N-6 DNA methylase [candidate division WOR-3 bacterium]